MNKPWRITFTGIDESCAIDELLTLLYADHRIELGILYSETKAGTGRYPTPAWIRQTAGRIYSSHGYGRVALHVCGRAVKRLLRGEKLDPELPSLWEFERIQLNGHFDSLDTGPLRRFIGDGNPGFRVITQFDGNPTLHDSLRRPAHQVLFDSSGGQGVERSHWPTHLADWDCGYAGGLGPDNLRRELPRIAEAASVYPYWIDMESKLREDDRFSIARARLALDAVLGWESGVIET